MDTFAVIIGGAAGALIGLLFVSVSIRIEVISASPDFRNRGAATLSLFTTVLLVAVLLGISQPLRAAAARTIVSTRYRQPPRPGNPRSRDQRALRLGQALRTSRRWSSRWRAVGGAR